MAAKARSAQEARALLEDRWEDVRRLLGYIRKRQGLIREEAEDFYSFATLKLVENDYAILRRFQGRSKLTTYLSTVLHRLLLDFRIAKWGKWRPCAQARRLGEVGIQLDRLLNRERCSLNEAVEILRVNFAVPLDRGEIFEMAKTIPIRNRPRRVGADEMAEVPGSGKPDEEMAREDNLAAARKAQEIVEEALAELSLEDRILLKLRFQGGLTIPQIAKILRRQPKPLYREIEKVLGQLRRKVRAKGLRSGELQSLNDLPSHPDLNFQAPSIEAIAERRGA